MKRLLAAAALVALALAGSASGGQSRAHQTISTTVLVHDGHVRITAIVRTPVEVGRPLTGTFHIQNLSGATQTLQLDYPTSFWFVIRSPDGTRFDSRVDYELTGSLGGPYRPPTKLKPGRTVTRPLSTPLVRWSGPLSITLGWNNTALPPVHIPVTTPGPAPGASTALSDVVAATGHLLMHCAPASPGVAVTGTIAAPEHSAPPMRAACSISLRRESGFVRAQVLVVSPPKLRVRFRHPYERLPFITKGNSTAVGWMFVVTRRGAISVDSTSVNATKNAHGRAPDWQWTTSGFQPQPGGSKCGGFGGGGGGAIGPLIEFVSACG